MHRCISRVLSVHCGSTFRVPVSVLAGRGLRGVVKRQPYLDEVKTLKGKVKTEYDSAFDDQFSAIQDAKDLQRMVQHLFVNTDETQTPDEYDLEENYEDQLEHAEKYYEMNIQEEKAHKSMKKKKTVERKYFKEPRETCLLTYAAKMQIHYLHEMDPVEWSPEKLAESFPVSVKGVKRLLKSKFRLNDEEKVRKHDEYVALQWKLLESGDTQSISPITRQLYMEGKISKDHSCGHFGLPSPVPPKKVDKVKPTKIGEHAAMIKYYVDLKKKDAEANTSLEARDTVTDVSMAENKNVTSQCERREIQKSVLPEFKSRYPTQNEIEDRRSASFLAAEKPDIHEIEIPQSQFEENLLQEYSEKHNKSSVDVAYEEWLQKQILDKFESSERKPQPVDSGDFFEMIKKTSSDGIELHYEKNNVYLHNDNFGYSQPVKKYTIQRHIKIPKEKYVPGALYRVGKSFYDDDGEFLYKVCV